jgi:CRISP-associated protein Cas1
MNETKPFSYGGLKSIDCMVALSKFAYKTKYLRGFALALRMYDKRVLLRNGTDLLTPKHEDELFYINQLPYDRIIIAGKGFVSTDAIRRLTDNGISITLLDSFGNYISSMSNTMSSAVASQVRIGQYDTFRNEEKTLYLQKQIVKARLISQINLLKDYKLERIAELEHYLSMVEQARDRRDLLGIEAKGGTIYFGQYVRLFAPSYGFKSRRGDNRVMSNKHAGDVLNALLNYGFSVLLSEIIKNLNGAGLDPYYSFYHKTHQSFIALAYDLIEPYRALVENSLVEFAGQTSKEAKLIRKYEFTYTGEGQVILSEDLIKRYLATLSSKLEAERLYKYNHGMKRRDGLSLCKESTIIKITIARLVQFCTEKSSVFEI